MFLLVKFDAGGRRYRQNPLIGLDVQSCEHLHTYMYILAAGLLDFVMSLYKLLNVFVLCSHLNKDWPDTSNSKI